MREFTQFPIRRPGTTIIILTTVIISLLITLYNTATKPADVKASMEKQFEALRIEVRQIANANNVVTHTLDLVGAALIHADPSGKITWWNQNAADLWGYPYSAGPRLRVEDLMHKSVRLSHARTYRKSMDSPNPRAHGIHCKHAERLSGELFEIWLIMVADPNGGAVAMALDRPITFKDITPQLHHSIPSSLPLPTIP